MKKEKSKPQKRNKVREIDFIGKMITLLKILQEKTDEETTLMQKELLEEMTKREYACSERVMVDYLRGLASVMNPTNEAGQQDLTKEKEKFKILYRDLEKKLRKVKEGASPDEIMDQETSFQISAVRFQHLFSFKELNQVIESVMLQDNLNEKDKENLVRKLVKLSSKNFLRHCPFVSETTGTVHSKITGVYKNSRIDEKNVFINLKKIEEAIQDFGGKGGKIGFHFYGYDEKKELIPRKNADGSLRWYIIDPYYILLYNGKYYLVGALDGYDNVSFYRMDLMFDLTTKPKESLIKKVDPLTGEIKRVKTPRRKTVEIKGLPNKWDSKTASKFQAQHLYMYYGETEEITLKVDRERYTLIHDYWGENYTFIKHIDEKYDEVVLECVPEAMEVWALQCSDCVEVLTPQNLRNRIKEKCEKLAAKYGKTL